MELDQESIAKKIQEENEQNELIIQPFDRKDSDSKKDSKKDLRRVQKSERSQNSEKVQKQTRKRERRPVRSRESLRPLRFNNLETRRRPVFTNQSTQLRRRENSLDIANRFSPLRNFNLSSNLRTAFRGSRNPISLNSFNSNQSNLKSNQMERNIRRRGRNRLEMLPRSN